MKIPRIYTLLYCHTTGWHLLSLLVFCCLVPHKLADMNFKFRSSNMAELLCYVYISQFVVSYVCTVWSPVSQVVDVYSRNFRAWLRALGIAFCACWDLSVKFTLSNSASIWYDRSNIFFSLDHSLSVIAVHKLSGELLFRGCIFQNTAFSRIFCTTLLRNGRTRW